MTYLTPYDPQYYSSLLRSMGELAFAYVDFIVSSVVVEYNAGRTDSLGDMMGNEGLHEPATNMGPTTL